MTSKVVTNIEDFSKAFESTKAGEVIVFDEGMGIYNEKTVQRENQTG